MLAIQVLDQTLLSMAGEELAEYTFTSAAHGFHQEFIRNNYEDIYHRVRTPRLGQHLHGEREHGNTEDWFTVAVVKKGVGDTESRTVVGHLPREVSQVLWYFLGHGGEIECEVTGTR